MDHWGTLFDGAATFAISMLSIGHSLVLFLYIAVDTVLITSIGYFCF